MECTALMSMTGARSAVAEAWRNPVTFLIIEFDEYADRRADADAP
jgi:hypothetical protein